MTRKTESTEPNSPDADPHGFRWDWVTFAVALLALAFLAMLTFEFWVPHDFLPRR